MTVAQIRRAAGTLVTAASIGLLVAVLAPAPIGGWLGVHVVDGTSMQPTYVSGDLLVSLRSGTYEVGDVIVFSSAAGPVVHRVVSGDGDSGYATRGDNRSTLDPWQPTNADVRGRTVLRVPAVGTLVDAVRSGLGPEMLALLSALLLIAASRPRRSHVGASRWPPTLIGGAIAAAALTLSGTALVVLGLRGAVPEAVARLGVGAAVFGALCGCASLGIGTLGHVRLRSAAWDLRLGRRVVDVDTVDIARRCAALVHDVHDLRDAADRSGNPVLRIRADAGTAYAVVLPEVVLIGAPQARVAAAYGAGAAHDATSHAIDSLPSNSTGGAPCAT